MSDISPWGAAWASRVLVELFISGAWVNVGLYLSDEGISIIRSTDPQRMTLRLKNGDGRFSPRNPSSTYFGLIGRNTPIRVRVQPTVGGTIFIRFQGEVVTWTQEWTKTGSKDATVQLECAGALRRISQGASPLRSPLYRALSTIGTNLVAYWPMEDGSDAKSLTVVKGTKAMTFTGTPNIGAYAGFASSGPIPTLQDGKFIATVPAYTPAATPVAQIRWVSFVPNGTADFTFFRAKCSGTLNYVELRYVSASDSFTIEGIKDDGTSAGVGTLWHNGAIKSRKQRWSVEMTQSGANISVSLIRYEIGATAGAVVSGSFTAATIGSITSVELNPLSAASGDVAVGHLTVEKAITSLFTVSASTLAGYAGELAWERINRLCTENSLVPGFVFTNANNMERMGAQGLKTLPELLQEAADTDGGALYEPRASSQDINYRSLENIYLAQQTPVVIPYTDNLLRPFLPVEDDQATRNRVTITRDGGRSSTVEDATSTLGTAAVGVYDTAETLSLYLDSQADDQASWRVHLGTVDEARWPTIGVELSDSFWFANTALRDQVLNASLGTYIQVTNLPSWLPPFPVQAIVMGYTENIGPLKWSIQFECDPASPYNALHWNTSSTRLSGAGTVLAGTLTSTATSFTVTLPAGVQWTAASGSYSIVVNGEVMTVTNVTGGNTFTVVRSVNGVVKSHAAGSAIALLTPSYYGL